MKPVMVALLSLACAGGARASDAVEEWQREATARVLKENKRKVVEALFPNEAPTSFWVSVRDDGKRRDGFAEYLCLEVRRGRPATGLTVIRIFDAAAMARGKMRELGRHDCE
jgi:hypothetical protein